MAELLLQAQKALLIFLCLSMQKNIDIMETKDAELHEQRLDHKS
jgi:hypothetical protein